MAKDIKDILTALRDYSLRKASIGLRAAAFMAGRMPKKRPTETEKPTAKRKDTGVKTGFKSVKNMTILAMTTPVIAPIRPPSVVKIIDSTIN